MAKSTQNETTKIIIIALLVLNILFGVYIAFIKPDAYSLETLKVWGKENMNMATQLYKSDMYKDQQKSTLEQILGSMNQANLPLLDDSQVSIEGDGSWELESIEIE